MPFISDLHISRRSFPKQGTSVFKAYLNSLLDFLLVFDWAILKHGHLSDLKCYLLALAACSWSLSCWKVSPLQSQVFSTSSRSIQVPVPASEMHPHSMPSPSFSLIFRVMHKVLHIGQKVQFWSHLRGVLSFCIEV